MRELIGGFLSREISRRSLMQSLAAMGITAAGIDSIVQSAEAADSSAGAAPRTMTGTGGELMVEQMKAAGTRYLFTNPGSFEVGFFDAFLDTPGVNLIMGLHEGLVIAMADGYNKVSGDPSFVNLHVMAGTAQAAGQMYNASRDGSSLVVTAGMVDNQQDSDNVLLGARPGFDQKDVNRQFTKISWETQNAAGIPMMLRRAYKVAGTPPGGPVYLALPNHELERKNVTGRIYDRDSFMIPSMVPPNPDDVERLARALLSAKNPVMILGDEVARFDAQPEALELAELLNLPAGESGLTAFHCFPRQHGLYAGANTRGKDLVLAVGAPKTGGGTGPVSRPYDDEATVAAISLDTNEMGRTHRFDIAMVANPKLALRDLIDAVKSIATDGRLEKIRADRPAPKSRKRQIAKDRIGKSPIHPDELGLALEEELDKNAIVVSENLSGSNGFLSTGFREDEKMWLSTSGAGLGWGIGASTGAKLADPNRQVVCNIGDGAVMYSAAGFWTQARYEVPVLTVVCNNHNYQTVRNAYVRYGGKMKDSDRYTGMYLGNPEIDFAGLAKSQGVDGVTVEKSSDLRPALKRGIAATREGRPFLIDVVVSRVGGGADSTWFQAHSVAKERKTEV